VRHGSGATPARVHDGVLGSRQYAWLAVGLAVLTVYGNLIPFDFRPLPLDEAAAAFRQMAVLSPAITEARGDWMVSVLLFAALSYTVTAAVSIDCPWDVGLGAAVLVVSGCLLLSVVIEFVQVFFPPRTVSVNDIVLESLGACAGVILWLAAGQRLTNWGRRLAGARTVPALARLLLPGYLVLLVGAELMPLDFILGAPELALKYHEGKIHLVPFYDLASPLALLGKVLSNMAIFFPVGLLAALGSATTWGGREWRKTAWFGLALAAAVEVGKLLIYSRFCDATDLFTGTVAVLAGAWVGRLYWRNRPVLAGVAFLRDGSKDSVGRALAAAVAGWTVLLVLVNWWPFDFTADPTRFPQEPGDMEVSGLRHVYWLPLVDYYWGSKYQALDQFGHRLAGFMPFGALAALWLGRSARPHRRWAVGSLALLLPAAIETGKYFLPSHSPSVTNAIIGQCGVGLGFFLTRHLATFSDLGALVGATSHA
jgi:glycopeptide antibiotics resistance protein